MTDPKACIICGCKDFAEYGSAIDHLVSEEEFLLLKCTHCGFVFTAAPPEEDDINEYYLSEDYISHADRKKSITEVIYHLVRRRMLRKKCRIVTEASGRKTGTILDLGSGTGYFASFMQSRNWKATGVEISERVRNFSMSKFGIEVFPPEKVKSLEDKSFDCITLWHVLEHFHDPQQWLSEINRLLKDDGKCIIALPNIKSVDSTWFGCNWAALDVPRHLWHFEPETLRKLAWQKGFSCLEIKGLPFDLFYISILTYKNTRKHFPFLRGLATGSFLMLRSFLKKFSSSSLVYILEKKKD